MSDCNSPGEESQSAQTPDEPDQQTHRPAEPRQPEEAQEPGADEQGQAPEGQAPGQQPQNGGAETTQQREPQPEAAQPPGDQQAEEAEPEPNTVARYGRMKHIGVFRCNWKELPSPAEKVVLRTERGVELGEVLTRVGDTSGLGWIARDRLDEFIAANGPDYPFRRTGKVLRRANQQDLIDYRHLESSACDEGAFSREQIRQLSLAMKLVAVEHLLGGERIIFYFTADGRVDFRELVRRLAGQYHTRVEMRQVGARDEARLLADYERCGRRCCCQEFLKYLQPVSMRMAKTQKATLDPAKISGRCGRLMCCLRYEDEGYEDLRRRLPKKNTWVRTKEHVGRVVDFQILTQLVQLVLSDQKLIVVANEDIIERDVPEPPPPGEARAAEEARPPKQPAPAAEAPQQPAAAAAPPADEKPEAPAAEQRPAGAQADQQPDRRKKRRRRKRKKKRPNQEGAAGQPAQPKSAQPQQNQPSGRSASGKKRRRRRKRR